MRVFKKAAPSRLSDDIGASTDDPNDLLDELDADGELPERPTDSSQMLDQFGDRLCDYLHDVYNMYLSEVRITIDLAFYDGRTTQLTAVRNNRHRWPLNAK